MKQTIKIHDTSYTIDWPSICPHCNYGIKAELKCYHVSSNKDMDISFLCPHCEKLFIANYCKSEGLYRQWHKQYTYSNSALSVNIDEEIKTLSPGLAEIYQQAIQAEKMELKHLAGMGLRKALEFLIKDFCIRLYPKDREKILKSSLSNCIKNYFENSKFQKIAIRAVWLGNDESHYKRSWENHDIQDLKQLLEITQYYISCEIHAEKYIAQIVREK